MTRRNALLRLHLHLLMSRQLLSRKLTGGLANLHDSRAADSNGDSGDLAFEGDADEMSSRLAELDDLALGQIEGALARWDIGTFGLCANCEKQIPLARLNALPHTALCIRCERAMETLPTAPSRRPTGHWDQVVDAQAVMKDKGVDLAELELQMTEIR